MKFSIFVFKIEGERERERENVREWGDGGLFFIFYLLLIFLIFKIGDVKITCR